MTNDTAQKGATMIKIKKTRIALTTIDVYSAWEPIQFGPLGYHDYPHSTITTIDDEWYGRIGTDPAKIKYQDLPVGPERFEAVDEAYQERYQVAYEAILAEYPEAAKGRFQGGEIEVDTAS